MKKPLAKQFKEKLVAKLEPSTDKSSNRLSFKEYLAQMPDVGSDEIFKRHSENGRKVKL